MHLHVLAVAYKSHSDSYLPASFIFIFIKQIMK